MNATGHMLISRIAWDSLTPSAREAVKSLTADPNNPAAGEKTSSQDCDLFTASTWMDDIKPTYHDLHYVNNPIDGDGALPPGRNHITFLNDNLAILKNGKSSQDQKAEALRVVEHLVGDAHQPLHNADNHDRGGNDFKLGGKNNLHGFWDAGGNQWGSLPRPLSPKSDSKLADMAAEVEKEFPEKSLSARTHDLVPEHWAHEGWELARTDVYTGVKSGSPPSAEYTERARHDMDEQAALGGYRLANLLNGIFTAKIAA